MEAHQLAVKLGLQRESSEALNHLGIAMYMMQRYDDGEDFLNQAIAEAREAGYNRVVINAYSNLGAIYSVRSQFSEALTVMYHALTWIEEHPEEGVDAWPMLNNIACTNQNIGDSENSLAYHRRALALAREHEDDSQIGTTLTNLGMMHRGRGQIDTALRMFKETLALARTAQADRRIARAHSEMGETLVVAGRPTEAVPHLLEAERLNRKLENQRGLVVVWASLAHTYTRLKRYDEAKELHELAARLSARVGLTKNTYLNWRDLAILLEQEGELEQAALLMHKALCVIEEGETGKSAAYTGELNAHYLNELQRLRTVHLERVNAELEAATELLQRRQRELADTASRAREMRKVIRVCPSCRKVREDEGYWSRIEVYISQHSSTEFSHSLCPKCLKELYPDLDLDSEEEK